MSHTVVELPAPSHTRDYEGNVVATHWDVEPPEGFTDAVDHHHCAANDQCPGYRPQWNWSAPVGSYLACREDNYGAEHEYVAWAETGLVDGVWVVCADCANAIEEGDLTISADGVWTWREDDAA